MSEFLRELTPEEIKLATIQFMGQHLTGDLKVLDSHLVSKNRTCQGMTINPTEIVNSIGPTPYATTVNAGINVNNQQVSLPPQPSPQIAVTVTETEQKDPNQLEFNFETSPYSKQIFDALERIEKKLDRLLKD